MPRPRSSASSVGVATKIRPARAWKRRNEPQNSSAGSRVRTAG